MADTDKLDGITLLNERKRRLFAVACVRRVWDLVVDERSRRSVEVAELYADGLATEAQLNEAQTVAWEAAQVAAREEALAAAWAASPAPLACAPRAFQAAAWAAVAAVAASPTRAARAAARAGAARAAARAGAVRAAARVAWEEARAGQLALLRKEFLPAVPTWCVEGSRTPPLPRIDPAWLAWNDGTVTKIAATIYQDKRFQDTPILADALEEAGCTVVSVLEHLRGGGHVRGCWAMDLLLGKE